MQSAARTSTTEPSGVGLVRGLSLLDSILLIVGGVIGGAIFLTPSDVAAALPSPLLFLGVWIAGGAVALIAGFAFGELGAMYPEAGGQYVYLREAYGELVAFLYGWTMFVAGNGGGIATIAVSFAEYFGKIAPVAGAHQRVLAIHGFAVHAHSITSSDWVLTRGDLVAVAAIWLLTGVNVWGLRRGAILQNVATWMKFAAIAVFVVLGFAIGHGHLANFSDVPLRGAFGHGLYPLMSAAGVAFIAVFWSYDGWVYASWVGGEIKRPERNVPRSLIIGIAAIAALYVAMNGVYLYALPTRAMAQETVVAHAAAVALFSPSAALWLSALIAVSCFGALSSNLMAAARVSYAMGRDGVFFRRMADVHPRWRTPSFALIAQAIWGSLIALSGTYDQLFTYAVFALTVSYVITVVALFVLRRKRPDIPRPYRCTGYPWLPGLYVVLIGGWAINTVIQRPRESLSGLLLLALGLPGYLYWRRVNRRRSEYNAAIS